MIPSSFITAWREYAPWPSDAQVEQDLVISRCLVELFSESELQEKLSFRGGTALYKLFAASPVRYSEDIDLVRTSEETGIENIARNIVTILDPVFTQSPTISQDSFTYDIKYAFTAENAANTPLFVKIEINKRDFGSFLGYRQINYSVDNDWFSGAASIRSYSIEELLSTKLIALLRRRKGRDLFDLWYFCKELDVDLNKMVETFNRYVPPKTPPISRDAFLTELSEKAEDPAFRSDVDNYLTPGTKWEFESAMAFVIEKVLPLLE
jgi:predicted nucleotidyltransferase component of viral defense system